MSTKQTFCKKETYVQRARKKHRCCECFETITEGDSYERVTELVRPKWYVYCTCTRCIDIRDKFMPDDHIYGTLREILLHNRGIDYVTEDLYLDPEY